MNDGRARGLTAVEYRAKAAEFEALSKAHRTEEGRLQFALLARSYELLAQQAERNSHTNIVYETPGREECVAQQQQQVQPDKE